MWNRPNEYRIEDVYPSRLRWHVERVMDGMYGMVLSDLKSLPVVDDGDVRRLEETYTYLTKYYKEGIEDTERVSILQSIGRDILKNLRKNASYIECEDNGYGERAKTLQILSAYGLSISDLIPLIEKLMHSVEVFSTEYFDVLDRIFSLLWTSLDLSEEHSQALSATILSEDSPELVAMNMVGALFLGAMEYFDAVKIKLLLSLYQYHQSNKVRGASMVALIMLGRRHEDELQAFYPDLTRDIQTSLMLSESRLIATLNILQASYKTADNHKIFKEKILPNIRSISDKMQQVMGNSLSLKIEELQKLALDDEIADEVSQLMDTNKGKLSMISGGEQDVAFHLITDLKGFPFFSKISHWFLPFTEKYPSLSEGNISAFKQMLPMIMGGLPMISSDMYSYAFVPIWGQVGDSISAQMDADAFPTAERKQDPFLAGVRELVFGAYRFYYISQLSKSLINPFAKSPFVIGGAFLNAERQFSEEGLLSLATMMINYGQYAHAGSTYGRSVEEYFTDTAEVWRGMAVDSMMRRDDEKALQQLRRAVEIEGLTEVTLRRIAQLLLRLSRKEETLKWLNEGEEKLGDAVSYKIPLLRAKLYYEEGMYENALKATYKADYLSDGHDTAIHALLLELLVREGRANEASDWIERHPNLEGELKMWAGIVALALGNRQVGLGYLSEWAYRGSQGEQLSYKLPLLREYGFEKWEEGLIQDIVYNKRDK